MSFAYRHRNYDWDTVIFSDECSFQLNQPGYGWAPKGQMIHQECLAFEEKVQLWGAIGNAGKVCLVTLKEP